LHNSQYVSGAGNDSAYFNQYAGRGSYPQDASRNFTIRGNYIVAQHPHGIAMGSVLNLLVEGNTIRRQPNMPDQDGFNPRVTFIDRCTGTVRNNVVASDRFWTFRGNPNNLSPSNAIDVLQVTESDTAFPVGWRMPNVGRGALGW
jgi:hypothetical protein